MCIVLLYVHRINKNKLIICMDVLMDSKSTQEFIPEANKDAYSVQKWKELNGPWGFEKSQRGRRIRNKVQTSEKI